MIFPVNTISNYNSINVFEPHKVFNSYLKQSKNNRIKDNINKYHSPSAINEKNKRNVLTPKNKRININRLDDKFSMDRKFINFCDEIKKYFSANREIDKFNLKRKNNMNINNMHYIYINSSFKNICPSLNKLLEKTNYNKKAVRFYNKDNNYGIWSIGTSDKLNQFISHWLKIS